MSSTTSFNFTELSTALQAWLEDSGTEFTGNIETIISLGESRLATDLNFEIFDEVSTAALTPAVREQPIKPALLQGTRSIHLRDVGGTGLLRYLRLRTYEYCADFAPDISVQAEPIFYAELDELNWYMVPTPDVAYQAVIRAIVPPEALTVGTPTSWMGSNAGDVLFYACLMSSEEFLKSKDRAAEWKQSYAELLPMRKVELRRQIRSDYNPVRAGATPVQ